ncbi:hypothetical protein PUN28_016550 [Cardiocondyla obscurior]|uniref:Uncharacterized protein n=1 Tax=Cardiocondyla obscurior TaxID=286306 RepID=A0AAW2EMN9_9HYME
MNTSATHFIRVQLQLPQSLYINHHFDKSYISKDPPWDSGRYAREREPRRRRSSYHRVAASRRRGLRPWVVATPAEIGIAAGDLAGRPGAAANYRSLMRTRGEARNVKRYSASPSPSSSSSPPPSSTPSSPIFSRAYLTPSSLYDVRRRARRLCGNPRPSHSNRPALPRLAATVEEWAQAPRQVYAPDDRGRGRFQ